MKEKFEHKLIQKIKDVFDSNQPDFNPQDWENMKTRLTENHVRKIPVFWTMIKAASVLLVLLIGTYFIWQRLIQPVDQVSEKATENSLSISKEYSEDNQQPEKEDQSKDSRFFSEPLQSGPIKKPVEIATSNVLPEYLKADDSVFMSNESSELAITTDTIVTHLPEESEAMISEQSEILISENLKEPKDSVLTFVSRWNPYPDITLAENKKQKQKMKVGVELASFTNYASEELEPEMNFGAGLTANIPIKSRFSFAPGIILSSYNMQVENTEQLSNKNTTPTTSGINTFDDADRKQSRH